MELVLGNIFVRPNVFDNVGDVIQGHTHNFDHVSYVPRGGLRFEIVDLDTGVVLKTIDKWAKDSNNFVLIKADACHRITALEAGSILHCIYAHRDPQGEVVQAYDGWTKSYV